MAGHGVAHKLIHIIIKCLIYYVLKEVGEYKTHTLY